MVNGMGDSGEARLYDGQEASYRIRGLGAASGPGRQAGLGRRTLLQSDPPRTAVSRFGSPMTAGNVVTVKRLFDLPRKFTRFSFKTQ